MDFMWNELRRVMVDPDKHLTLAPYIMYMVERVTKITFPKDHKHEPLHLCPRSGDAPPHLLGMLEPPGQQGQIPLHPPLLHLTTRAPLVVTAVILSSRGPFAASSACARLLL